MKIFKSKIKNILYFWYRLINPIFDPIKFVKGIKGYFWFIKNCFQYKIKNPKAKIFNLNLFPVLGENISSTQIDNHYFYQQVWAFGYILQDRPEQHIDIGSSYQMSGYISQIVKTKFIDLRPIKAELANLEIVKADILNLPYKDNSIYSLSCLHVVEHIGLGRYGDKIDPKGTVKACKELSRILAPGGKLYISLPIGLERICFNAHRVHSVQTILKYFADLQLIEFSAVDDNGCFIRNCDYMDYQDLNYGCGMFVFTPLIRKP